MKVVYTQDQKREALALARREGIPAASRHYGVAKNTIYRWKAAMELNGLLEEDTVQENTTGELNETGRRYSAYSTHHASGRNRTG